MCWPLPRQAARSGAFLIPSPPAPPPSNRCDSTTCGLWQKAPPRMPRAARPPAHPHKIHSSPQPRQQSCSATTASQSYTPDVAVEVDHKILNHLGHRGRADKAAAAALQQRRGGGRRGRAAVTCCERAASPRQAGLRHWRAGPQLGNLRCAASFAEARCRRTSLCRSATAAAAPNKAPALRAAAAQARVLRPQAAPHCSQV